MDISIPLVCLALNVYHEARSEPLTGQLAVALTTLNRAHHRKDRICPVVFAERQFSWTMMPDWAPRNERAWKYSVKVAQQSFKIQDFTCGATHYHAKYLHGRLFHPAWASKLTFIGQYGAHLFYIKGEPKCPKQ